MWQLGLETLVILPALTALSWLPILVMGFSSGVLLVLTCAAFHSSFAWRIELSPSFTPKGKGSVISLWFQIKGGDFSPGANILIVHLQGLRRYLLDPAAADTGSQVGRQPIWQPSSLHKNRFCCLGLSPAACIQLVFAMGNSGDVVKSHVLIKGLTGSWAEEALLVKSSTVGGTSIALCSLPCRGLHPWR